LGISLLCGVFIPSCTNDLNQAPESTNAIPGDQFFTDAASYKQNLANYIGFATSGQGTFRVTDISGIDEEKVIHKRILVITELTTDEAVIAWNDGTIKDLHSQTWTSLDRFVTVFARYSFKL
jgi:hypothetical protein